MEISNPRWNGLLLMPKKLWHRKNPNLSSLKIHGFSPPLLRPPPSSRPQTPSPPRPSTTPRPQHPLAEFCVQFWSLFRGQGHPLYWCDRILNRDCKETIRIEFSFRALGVSKDNCHCLNLTRELSFVVTYWLRHEGLHNESSSIFKPARGTSSIFKTIYL